MAFEQLVVADKASKSDAVRQLAAAASLFQLRAEITRILDDARSGLWLTACLKPADEALQALVDRWIPDLQPERRALLNAETSEAVLLVEAMKPLPPCHDALTSLWEYRLHVPALEDAIRPKAPIAAAGLHDFRVMTCDGVGKAFDGPGTGRKLAEHLRDIYQDISSFFAHVYEMRNRVVHGGDAFDRGHDPSAVDVYTRFVALLEPVLHVMEARVAEGMSLKLLWGVALDKAQDLATLSHGTAASNPSEIKDKGGGEGPTPKESMAQAPRPVSRPLTLERLTELLSF